MLWSTDLPPARGVRSNPAMREHSERRGFIGHGGVQESLVTNRRYIRRTVAVLGYTTSAIQHGYSTRARHESNERAWAPSNASRLTFLASSITLSIFFPRCSSSLCIRMSKAVVECYDCAHKFLIQAEYFPTQQSVRRGQEQ